MLSNHYFDKVMGEFVVKAIEVEGLNYYYPNSKNGVVDIGFSIKAGEKVGFMGPNGSGKTTLLLHLNGIIAMNKKVKIFNKEVNKKNIRFIRKNVGLIFQNADYQLFSLSVYDDIAYGPKNLGWDDEKVDNAVKTALKQVDMEGFEKRFPQNLSIGEKKRIAIATVLSMDPKILVLDEPTSSLDPQVRRDLINLLKTFKDKTIIIASHDLELIDELCNRVVHMNKGKIESIDN